jgi:uncharacterized damage-inducible protein DinB
LEKTVYLDLPQFMSTKSILKEQFEACFDQSAWFASAKSALENLSAESAVWKPTDEVHSICEIITHLNFYNSKHLQRFKGIEVTDETIEIAETFSPEDQDWHKASKDFDAIMSEWKKHLEAADDVKLSSKWSSVIAHINIHNAYHIGQIVLVRKLQANWDDGQGVS